MKTLVTRHEIERFMREHLGVEAPADVLRIEMTPREVTVTTLRRDEQGRAFLDGGEVASAQTVIGVRQR